MQLTAQLSGGASAAELATKLVTLKHPEPKADVWVASVRGIDVRRRGLCDASTRTGLTCRLWPARAGGTGHGTFVWTPPVWQGPLCCDGGQDTAAVLYPACGAGRCLRALMEFADPHLISSKGLEALSPMQAWWITVRPVCHHLITYLAQPFSRPSFVGSGKTTWTTGYAG